MGAFSSFSPPPSFCCCSSSYKLEILVYSVEVFPRTRSRCSHTILICWCSLRSWSMIFTMFRSQGVLRGCEVSLVSPVLEAIDIRMYQAFFDDVLHTCDDRRFSRSGT